MDDDPIASALRRDAVVLLERAPAPDAAALWHAIQRRRALRIQRIMNVAGWSLRAAIVLILAGVALWAPRSLASFAVPLALVGWLSGGICSPALSGSPSQSRETAGTAS